MSRGSGTHGGGRGAMRPLKVLLATIYLSVSLPLLAAHARDLVIFGEPTLATALGRLGAAWRERSGVRVNVFVAPSDLSFAQIQRGARCDVIFALAGAATVGAERQGIIKSKAAAPIVRNSLVVVARSGVVKPSAVANRAELASYFSGKRLAIANPDRDLAGTYGLAWLREIGTGGEGDKNVIVAESSAGVLTLLADNMAQLGIVYASDAAGRSDPAVVMPIPEQSHPAIEYVAVEAMDPQSDTKPFLDFLGSGQAKAILPAAGLQVTSK
jgi:molybdate transport system substrate-binding protein